MNLASRSISTVITLIVCAISGIISGFMYKDLVNDFVDSDCYFVCSEDLSITLFSLSPGIVFGLLFSITSISVNIKDRYFGIFRALGSIVAYIIGSTVIWFIAWWIAYFAFFIFSLVFLGFSLPGLLVAGLIAGFFGGGALWITTMVVSRFWKTAAGINISTGMWTAIVGALSGVVFFFSMGRDFFSSDMSLVSLMNRCVVFMIWQGAVGSALSISINK